VLAAAYRRLKERGAGFEVVLVSCDEDRPSFERFHRTMPWPAVPFGDLQCKKRLSERFQVEGIPRLVVLAPDGEVVHADAADLVHRYGEGAFPFTAARVAELEVDDERKYASQTLEKLFSIDGRGYVNGGKEQVVNSTCIGVRDECMPHLNYLSMHNTSRRWRLTIQLLAGLTVA
jgi:nucleoredoxin